MGSEATPQRAFTLRSFAKINLYLGIRECRADGFHSIETIFQTIDLSDELHFAEHAAGLVLDCDRADLDAGPANLVQRAAQALRDRTGCQSGARITLTKRIPIAAGLAGGSGNAAAALRGLKALWNLTLSEESLAAIALTLGSDVPYCLRGGTMAARGRGEELQALPPLEDAWFVLVHPQIEVSTAWVYAHPRLPRRSRSDAWSAEFRIARDALAARDWPRCLHNDMEDVAFEAHPPLRDIKRRLIDAGCIAACMSGSGPTIFGVAPSEHAARRAASAFSEETTTVTQPVRHGVA